MIFGGDLLDYCSPSNIEVLEQGFDQLKYDRDRVIYLRLKRPDDKVIAFSEKSFFKYQNVSLTYSAKREINYEGDRLEMAIYWPNDGSLVKGKYVAELFSDNELIGSTEFTLN